jgi:hypothetical protein
MTVGHPVVHTTDNFTAFIGVMKGGQIGLMGRVISLLKKKEK